jgi:hypothetical protein
LGLGFDLRSGWEMGFREEIGCMEMGFRPPSRPSVIKLTMNYN